MSSFLQLCADLARESGAVGSAPASVLNQAGRQAKCVAWIRDAWRAIQTDNPDYSFLRTEFESELSIGVMSYTPTALSITNPFARWRQETPEFQPVSIYPAGDQASECALNFIPYENWRVRYNRGTHDAMKPVHWSIAPDRSLLVGPKPDEAYVLRGEYQRGPQILAADSDIPIMPEQYHDAIVWRAAMMLASHDEAPVAYQSAATKYGVYQQDMARELLPALEDGGNALA